MQRLWVAILYAAMLLLSLTAPGQSQDQDIPKLPVPVEPHTSGRQKILFLNTFQIGLPIPDSIDRGVLDALKERRHSNNDIFIEHLDFAREPNREYRVKTAEMLRRKFAGKNIGIVIAEGSPVIDFLANEAKDLFPDAALLTLITPLIDTSLNSRKLIEIPWRVDLAGTLSVALDLFPKTRRAVVVTGARDSVLPFLEEAKSAIAPWIDRLDVEFTNEMTLEQMLQHVSTLPPDAIIIYSPFFTDTTGRSFVPAEVQVMVSRSANAPVFATLEAYLGQGIVGGSLLKTETIGQQAVKIALDYLQGNLKLEKPVTTFNASTQMMFDWNELSRWEANKSALPKNSIVINHPPTLYGQYKSQVIIIGFAFLTMSILVLTLLTLNRRLKRLTVTLGDSEARFRVMMEHAPEAIVVYDPDTRKIIDANPKAAQLFCCSIQDLLQADPERFYYSNATSGSDYIADHRSRALAGAEVLFELTIRTFDDARRDCEIRLVKLPFQGKQLLRASFVDITERKRAEEELRKSEAHLRTLVQTIPDLVWLKDKDGVYLSCNSIFERLFGAKQNEIVGKTDYDFVDRELADFFIDHDRKAIAAGRPSSNEEWVTYADDGHRVLLETIKTPMYDDTGTLIGVLGIGRDITERKRAEEEKSKLEIQLQQAQRIEAIGQLAGGVAHDFNNMLGVILGHTEMIMEVLDPAQAIYKDLEQIELAAKRSADITRQLLAFARKQAIAPKLIDLNETVESVLKMLRRLIGEDIELVWLPGGRLWPVKMDPSQIDQILANLCVNARGAIDGVGTITVGTSDITLDEEYCSAHVGFVPGDYVRLTVSDTGCGMSKETMAHIFEPFFTTKEVGEGTGLGLATVYGAVKQNNGFINVYSEVGRGTTFTIYLPRHRGGNGYGKSEEGQKAVIGGNETILVVEDEPTILLMAESMLQRLGYNVLSATSPDEAIRMASDFPERIDLLMTDVIMPEMNGRDLAANIVAIKPNLKYLFMSGYTADIITKQGVIDENLSFIQKPFSKTELADKIREVFDKPQSIAKDLRKFEGIQDAR